MGVKECRAKKDRLLGEPYGGAMHRLRKNIMFHLAQKLKMTKCFRCGEEIESSKEFSIEHKTSWLFSETPAETFSDLDNSAFSHFSCNVRASHRARTYVNAKEKKLEEGRRYRSDPERWEAWRLRREDRRQRRRLAGLPVDLSDEV